MKIFLTGGAGFIGSHFAQSAQALGHTWYVWDKAFRHNLTNRPVLNEAMNTFQPDWIVHLAATPGVSSDLRVGFADMENTYNLLESMHHGLCKKILFVSTGSVYGRQWQFPTIEGAPMRAQVSSYAAAKLACEGMIAAECERYKHVGVVLRLGTILGPGNRKGFTRDFVQKLQQDPTKLATLGDGKQVKSYLHIADMVDAMWRTMSGAQGFDVFNVAHDKAASIRDCIPWVCDEMGVSPEIVYGEGETGFFGDIPTIRLCNTKLRSLGWEPQYSIEQAVRANVRWLLDTPAQVAA
jgi:UDP-glucose 4-epimerase